jgi:hypothetical protein
MSEEKGRSHFLLMRLVNIIVERHGGHIDLDEENNTFTVTAPSKTKAKCFRELEEIMALAEPFGGFPTFVHT